MSIRSVRTTAALAASAIVTGLVHGDVPPCGAPLFPGRQSPPAGGPTQLLPIDLNGDGIPDLVTVHYGAFSVALGHGGGEFGPQTTYGSAAFTNAAVAEDLDGDGDLDLAFAGPESALVPTGWAVVFPGNGDGSFGNWAKYETGRCSVDIAAGDLNGDGIADLAVADIGDLNGAGTGVSVLLGNGDGSFQEAEQHVAGPYPSALDMADLDDDGDRDLAVGNWNDFTVTILLNDGDGTFEIGEALLTGPLPRSLVLDDLNGDGWADLAVANHGGMLGPSSVAVRLGDGHGAFDPPVLHSVNGPRTVQSRDLDGDGDVDLLVRAREGIHGGPHYCVTILLNEGDGAFAPPFNQFAGGQPTGLALADFNDDDRIDLAVGNTIHHGTALTLLLGNGDGTFGESSYFELEANLNVGPLTGDLDDDDDVDLVFTAHGSMDKIVVLLNNGDRTFAEPVMYDTGYLATDLSSLADLNGDGALDVLLTRENSPGVGIMFNSGDGTFGPIQNESLGPSRFARSADLDGDGDNDIVVRSIYWDIFTVMINVFGDASYFSRHDYPVDDRYGPIELEDLNADGGIDIVLGCAEQRTVSVYFNDGGGAFGAPVVYPTSGGWATPGSLAFGDVDADGDTDLAVAYKKNSPSANHVDLFFNNGDGSFAPPIVNPTELVFNGAWLGDVDRDGHIDLVTPSAYALGVMRGSSNGAFGPADLFASCRIDQFADLDGDGDADLTGMFSHGFLVLWNNSCPFGDLNGDGSVDVADLMIVLAEWGPCPPLPSTCPADLNGDGAVNVPDLLLILANWS